MRKRGESELPPTHTRRWTFRRKAALLQALRSGTITFEQACDLYALSIEELCFQSPHAIDQINQRSHAVWRVPLGIGKLNAEMLLEHRALTDHRLNGSGRDHGEG